MSNPEKKIENTFARSMDELNKLEKAFQPGKGLEQAIMSVGGDPSYLKDVAEALSTAYEMLEAAHYGALGHMDDIDEANNAPSQVTEGVLDGDDEDGFMARSQLYFLAKDAIKLHGIIDDRDNLEPWVQTKIAQASKDIDAVSRYTEYNAMNPHAEPEAEQPEMGMPEPEMEESVEESSEWEKRHDEFVDAGETATPQMIDSIIRELSDAATKLGSKGGFINSIIGKKSNGELARHKVSAETLARSIQRNKNAEQGTDERKELGQHLIYAQSLLGRVNEGSEERTEEYGIIRYPDTAISYIKKTADGWEHIFDKSYGFSGLVDKTDMQFAKRISPEKMPGRLLEDPVDRKMQVTDIDKNGNTEAWKRFKAGDPRYEYKRSNNEAIRGIRSAAAKLNQAGQGVRNKTEKEPSANTKINTKVVREESKFDDKNDSGELKAVANDMFKSALSKAKKKAKE